MRTYLKYITVYVFIPLMEEKKRQLKINHLTCEESPVVEIVSLLALGR